MKRLLTLAMVLSALLLTAVPAPAVTCTTTVPAGGDIQAFINTAGSGDVICLEPGTYTPAATITINKSLTLQGPQASVDPRPSAGTTRTPGSSSEAIVNGAPSNLGRIFYIDADNVVLNGLEVKSGTADMIRQSNAHSGTIVQYNIIHDGRGDEGTQLAGCTACAMEYNYVYDIASPGDALNFADSSNSAIRYNEVRNIGSENAAIYVYGSTNTTIQCNLVYDVYNNDGIKLGTKDGGDVALTGGSILYNIVHDTAQDGITVYTSNTLVEGNEIYNSTSENGAIYVAFTVAGVTISNNAVHDNALDTGKWGDPGAIMIGTSVNATTVQVHHNNISGNSPNGVTNKATATLDAENNWWGALDGPSGAGSGSGDSVSANVDFEPWLIEPQVIVNPCWAPQVIEVDIDIKPGSDPNCINLDSNGVIPVAILGSATFDAADVDPSSVLVEGAAVRLKGKSGNYGSLEDVNNDGYPDLVVHIVDFSVSSGATTATLTGELFDSTPIEGSDSICIVPPE